MLDMKALDTLNVNPSDEHDAPYPSASSNYFPDDFLGRRDGDDDDDDRDDDIRRAQDSVEEFKLPDLEARKLPLEKRHHTHLEEEEEEQHSTGALNVPFGQGKEGGLSININDGSSTANNNRTPKTSNFNDLRNAPLDPPPGLQITSATTIGSSKPTAGAGADDDTPLFMLDLPSIQQTLDSSLSPPVPGSIADMHYPSPSSALMEDFAHDPSDGTDGIERELDLPSLSVPPMELLAQRRAKSAMSERFPSLPAPRKGSVAAVGTVGSLVGAEAGGKAGTLPSRRAPSMTEEDMPKEEGGAKMGRMASLKQKFVPGRKKLDSDTFEDPAGEEEKERKGMLDRVRRVSLNLRNRSRSSSRTRASKLGEGTEAQAST
jgi:hypothetical protein